METILIFIPSIIWIEIDKITGTGHIRKNAPIVVLMPLPPLNDKKGENIWPITEDNAIRHVDKSEHSVKSTLNSNTIRRDFKISNACTNIEIFLPTTLLTFVEPIFPLPSFLMSLPVLAFTNIYPNGIAPIKNENNKYNKYNSI